jgi:hypothetical protein
MKNISHKEFFEFIDYSERNLTKDDWRVSGIDIWPVVKIYYSYYVITQLIDKRGSQIHKFQGNLAKAMRALKILVKSLIASLIDKKNNEKLKSADLVIFVQSSTRYFKNDGCWYSPFSDTLQTDLKKNGVDSLVFETTEDAKFLFPRFGPTLLIQSRLILNMLNATVKSIFFTNKLESCSNWAKFQLIVEEQLGAEYLPQASKLNFHINNLLQQKNYFLKLLKAVSCRVCVMSGYYSSTMFALISACRALNVKTVEVQHGVQGESHLAYRSWLNLPVDSTNILPDYFWTWSSREKKVIDSWSDSNAAGINSFVGGNPCLTIYNRKGENIVCNNEFDGYKFPSGKVSKIVIFTCQAFELLSLEIINSIKQRKDFGWVIRIHPQYWQTEQSIRSQCQINELNNVVIDNGELLPLSSALLCSTVHVTEFSSSVLEASAVGLHSIIINPYGRDLYSDLIEAGYATYIPLCESIIRKIDSITPVLRDDFALLNQNKISYGVSVLRKIVINESISFEST